MVDLRKILAQISRFKHSRGFGVQSPWAYDLICNVINEQYPFYAYDEMAQSLNSQNEETQKLCKLFIRLANRRQPTNIIMYGEDVSLYEPFLRRGCMKAQVEHVEDLNSLHLQKIDMLLISTQKDYLAYFDQILNYLDNDSMVIINYIQKNKQCRDLWNKIKEREECISTFDLYECGIIFFDKKRYKQNYNIIIKNN